MIVRVLTATIKAERAGVFNELMRTQLPILREYAGLRYVKLSRRILAGEQEVLLFDGIDPFPEPRPPAVKPREED